MYEITKYVCEEDGKEFESESECRKYELELKYGAVIKNAELQLWDDNFKPISIDDTELDINHTTYFKCLTDRAADYLSDMCYEGGYDCAPDPSDILTGELYVYDENEDEFISFSELTKQVRDIMRAFKLKLEDIFEECP